MAQEEAGDKAQALRCYRGAIAAAPGFAAAQVNLGVLLFADGQHEAALQAYDQALMAEPGLAAAQSNRGNALRALGRLDAAAQAYRAAIAGDPGLTQAHNHLGNLLRDQGRLDEAAACFRAATQADPAFTEPFYNLGYVLMELGDVAAGFAALTRHAQLACREQPASAPKFKRQHDEEQRAFLKPGGAEPLGPLHLAGGAALPGPAIRLHANVEEGWQGDHPVVVIDDFLTQEALVALREFCAASTIWREVYDGGYLGAFPEHGVACPLLAQIALELPERYPRIFAHHPLLQIWAFKYGARVTGIPLHADFAAVNVNFWITPDTANLDPAHGGLVIWDKPAPLDWDFAKYNVDAKAGRRFLERQGAKSLTVPYRANRAAIFDSDLFHETDEIHFAPGYDNRRINLTLLYGRRG
jgi:Tfp pilus assembly protein PilF